MTIIIVIEIMIRSWTSHSLLSQVRSESSYLEIRNFEVERHVGHSNQYDWLEEHSPEMIGPLPLEDSEHPDDVRFLGVVGHGIL